MCYDLFCRGSSANQMEVENIFCASSSKDANATRQFATTMQFKYELPHFSQSTFGSQKMGFF